VASTPRLAPALLMGGQGGNYEMPNQRDIDDRRDNPELENDLDRDQPIGRSDEQTAGRAADSDDDEAFEDEEDDEEDLEGDDEVV
jgi:hypothetical protein